MINSELKHTDFSRYTFEEFLQNDFFTDSPQTHLIFLVY